MNFSAQVHHYERFLDPLAKWKVLDTQSLQQLSKYPGRYDSFCEILRKLKEKGIINWQAFTPKTHRFIYLTRDAHRELLPQDHYSLEDRKIFHDALVSRAARSFLEMGVCSDCELCHEYTDRRRWNNGYFLKPPAILFMAKNDAKFKIALELEVALRSKEELKGEIIVNQLPGTPFQSPFLYSEGVKGGLPC